MNEDLAEKHNRSIKAAVVRYPRLQWTYRHLTNTNPYFCVLSLMLLYTETILWRLVNRAGTRALIAPKVIYYRTTLGVSKMKEKKKVRSLLFGLGTRIGKEIVTHSYWLLVFFVCLFPTLEF